MYQNFHTREDFGRKNEENTPQMNKFIPHILIVDDEADIRNLLNDFLLKKGCKTATAETLTEAAEKLLHFIPTTILLDLNLPDGSGLHFLQKVKKENPFLPVIIISAYDNLAEKEKAYFYGAKSFIGKPFSLKQIWENINAKPNTIHQ